MLWQDKLVQNTRVLTNGYIQRTPDLSETGKKRETFRALSYSSGGRR